jgi:ABC-type multidrug transport system fused ATPase/permease subunit
MNLPVRRYFALLTTYLKPQRTKTILMIVCLLAGIAFQLIYPQITSHFIDTVSSHGPVSTLVAAGVLYIVMALLNQGIGVAGTYFSQYVAWTATNQLRSDLMAHCLGLDMGYHKAHTSGEMIERIDGDVDALSNFFSQFAVNLLSNLLLLVSMLVLFFLVHWLVGVVMTVFALLALALLAYLRGRAIPLWKEQRRMSATYYGFLGERLDGLEDIRANGAGPAIVRSFYQLLQNWLPINNRANWIGNLSGPIMLCFFICGNALALGLGFYLWRSHTVSLGTVYLLFAYTSTLSQPLSQIQDELADLQQAEACIQRVETLLNTYSALTDTGTKNLPAGPLKVEMCEVEFAYEKEEIVLHKLSLALAPGRQLGIVGRTGSGKTTLARLLFRLYDPQAGEICINDVPLPEIGLHELRRHIGMVTQDVQLFHASVRDNLTFFADDIPDAQIIAVLQEIGLRNWFNTLADGLETRLGSGEGETGLSAGEMQLLACARVFLVDPGIIILDEASSRLDPATEALIDQAITRLLEHRTALIIAHRLSTLQRVDEILMLEDGHIVEYGERIALEADTQSRFARLLHSDMQEVLV